MDLLLLQTTMMMFQIITNQEMIKRKNQKHIIIYINFKYKTMNIKVMLN